MKKTIIALVAVFAMALNANAQKFAHVDVQAVMESLPEYTRAQGDVKAKQQEIMGQAKELEDELQNNMEKYNKEKPTLTEAVQKTREQELSDQYQKVQAAEQQYQQELQKYGQEKMEPIQQKIMEAIQKVGKAGQYSYIFRAEALLYAGETNSKDIASEVKAEINKINAAAKPATASAPKPAAGKPAAKK